MIPVLTRERHAEEVGRYHIPFGRGLMGWAVDHGQPILANDALEDPRALQIPGTPAEPEAVAIVPLIADGDVLGVAERVTAGRARDPLQRERLRARAALRRAGIDCVRNADAHQAISQRAETDALTGLGNHGAFQRDLARAGRGIDVEARRGVRAS